MSDIRPADERVAHTPGPWHFSACSDRIDPRQFHWIIADRFPIATICGYAGCDGQEANARLIAAAPELLGWANKVLERYMPRFNDSRAVDDCLVGLAAAVMKAEKGNG